MKCKICHAELTEGQSFCSYCGTKVENPEPSFDEETDATVQQETIPADPQTQQDPPHIEPKTETLPTEEKDPADKHALVGMILGICSLVLCCIGLPTGIIGIIFSAKGLKSKTKKGMAIPGLITSILAVANFFSFWAGFIQGIEGASDILESMSVILTSL